MPEPSVEEYQAFARPKVEAGGYDWETFRKQIQQESNWRHLNERGEVKTSFTGSSKGISQLNQNFYGPELWQDPWTNLSKGIELAIGYLTRFGSHRKALAAFNWGPGNVGGYRDNAGRVHPAWDGTREWRCPHEAVVAQCRTAQRDHYLDVILGPGWPEPGTTNETGPSMTIFEDYRDPAPAGTFPSMPKGVILHGSRSGRAGNPKQKEYEGTANWEVNNPNGLGWHATIGEGKAAIHLTAREWGWHALQASKVYLGVEFAQATVDEPITDAQVLAFVDWFNAHVLTVWPSIPLHFPSHAEADVEFNQQQGKSDAFPLGDPRMDDLRGRIMALLESEPVKPGVPDQSFAPEGTVGTGLLEMMAEDGTVPAMPSTFLPLGANPAIAEQCWGMNGVQYLFHIPTGRRWRYKPAA